MSEAPRLDNSASSVSAGSEAQPKHPVQEWRYRLRRVSGRLLKQERVNRCGYRPFGQNVSIMASTVHSGMHYAGIETCGSVWVCPVCAGRVAERRRIEAEEIIQAHRSTGGAVYMATFTVRHHPFQRCADLREAVSAGWRKVQQGSVWRGMKQRLGVVGTVRALEVTHGENGWHPHLHVLVCTRGPLTELETAQLRRDLFKRWDWAVQQIGLKPCSPDAFKFDLCESPEDAGAYVAKWGASSELVKGHSKMARGSGMSPWQLLAEAGKGSAKAAALFREYADAFKGARQLTWSLGFRQAYGFGPEAEDSVLAADDRFSAVAVCSLPWATFRQIVEREIEVAVLCAAKEGGWPAVLARIREAGIAVDQLRQHLEREARFKEGKA